MKFTFSILSIALLCSFRMPSLTVALNGHLRSLAHKNVAGIYVLVKIAGYAKAKHATTDEHGDFHLEFNTGEESETSFYYIRGFNDTILLKHVINIPETSEMTFWIK